MKGSNYRGELPYLIQKGGMATDLKSERIYLPKK